MRIRRPHHLPFLLVLFTVAVSCAYYNGLYNANRLADEDFLPEYSTSEDSIRTLLNDVVLMEGRGTGRGRMLGR